jgi:hypothetical protein
VSAKWLWSRDLYWYMNKISIQTYVTKLE